VKTQKDRIVTLRVPAALIVAVDKLVVQWRRERPRLSHTRSSVLRELAWEALDLAEAKLAKPKSKA
jgi:hypothetical protein